MRTLKLSALFALCALPLTYVSAAVVSGPQVGSMVATYGAQHVTGDAAGKDWCPVCHYGRINSVQAWIHGDSMDNAGKIAQQLEKEMAKVGKFKLKAFVVFQKPEKKSDVQMTNELKALAKKYGIKQVALLYVKAGKTGPAMANKISFAPQAKNTIFTYRARKVTSNFVNLKPDALGLSKLSTAVQGMAKVVK